MNNPYLGKVNQQLIFARHQLQSRIHPTESQALTANERMRNQGILYAGIWHLRWAYRAYLAELGANYKLTKPELPHNAEQLSLALQGINKHPAEAQELQRLEQTGFVGEILSALEQIERIETGLVPPAPSGEQQAENLIDLKDITGRQEIPLLDFQQLENWINLFKELISRHRAHMIEY